MIRNRQQPAGNESFCGLVRCDARTRMHRVPGLAPQSTQKFPWPTRLAGFVLPSVFDIGEFRIMAALTPQAVLAMCRERDIKAVDLRFMDFPGHLAALHHSRRASSKKKCSKRASASTAPASAAGRRSTRATCSSCRRPTRRSSIRSPTIPTLVHDLQHPGPDHPRRLHARPAQRRPQGGQLPEEHRRRRHLLHRPRSRVLHLRRRPLRPDAQRRLLLPRQRRRPMEPRPRLPRRQARTWATSCATRKATSPCRRPTS